MTTFEIIKYLLLAFAAGIIKHLLDAVMPEKEKTRSLIKKSLKIIGVYGLPLAILIIAFLDDSPIDKPFIFKVVLFTTILLINALIDFLSLLLDIQKARIDLHIEKVTRLEDAVHNHVKATQEIVKLQNELFELIKENRKPLK